MFKIFGRKPKERSCKNCKYFVKSKHGARPICIKTNCDTLKAFPFVNTKCRTYEEK